MEQQSSGNKKIGIVIAVIAVLGLIGVTFEEKQKQTTSLTQGDANLGTTEIVRAENTGNLNTGSTQTTTPVTQKKNWFGDDGEGEDSKSSNVVVTPPVNTDPAAKYNDGIYTTTLSYDSPGGIDKMAVSVTLKNGTVSDTSFTNMAGNNTSSRYEDKFAQSYKPSVLGKNIATLSISKVSGASLTTAAFNNALNSIRTQAQA